MNPINSRMCSSQVPTATSRTILFVEDEDFLRTVIADVLTGAGYHVLSASNGVEVASQRLECFVSSTRSSKTFPTGHTLCTVTVA